MAPALPELPAPAGSRPVTRPTPPPLLELEEVHFTWPEGVPALDGVSFRVEQGESVAMVGPNGAGKSTTLLAILGFVRPQEGRIRVGGLDVVPQNFREIRRRLGAVFQNPDDQLFLPTLEEDVAFGPLNMGLDREQVESRVRKALQAMGLEGMERRPPHHLSAGEKRRAALATVLSMDPSLLALDEPASNLDPRGRRQLIHWLQASTLTKLLITHDLEMVLDLCSRVLLIDQGRIVASGSPLKLFQDHELMAHHGLEAPYSLRSDHTHRLPLGDEHHREHHLQGKPHQHPWQDPAHDSPKEPED